MIRVPRMGQRLTQEICFERSRDFHFRLDTWQRVAKAVKPTKNVEISDNAAFPFRKRDCRLLKGRCGQQLIPSISMQFIAPPCNMYHMSSTYHDDVPEERPVLPSICRLLGEYLLFSSLSSVSTATKDNSSSRAVPRRHSPITLPPLFDAPRPRSDTWPRYQETPNISHVPVFPFPSAYSPDAFFSGPKRQTHSINNINITLKLIPLNFTSLSTTHG